MALGSQRNWFSISLFASAVLVASTAGLWNLAAADDTDEPTSDSQPVPAVDGTDDASEAEKPAKTDGLPFAVPQPKPQPAVPAKKPAEDLEEKLEVVFEKPFRPVRGKEGRFDVVVRVKNKTDEPVEGPVNLQIIGSTFENLVVLDVPMVADNGDPMFAVIDEDKSLSHRSRRGKVLKLTFEQRTEEKVEAEEPPKTRSTALAPAEVEDEIDWRLTRDGMKLAEPMEFAEVRDGRGRGIKNRGLPIPADDPILAEASEAMKEAAPDILKIKGVEGTATGIDVHGNMVQYVFAKRLSVKDKLPDEIGGLPVKMELIWGFKAYQTDDTDDPNNRGQGGVPTFVPPPGTCPDLPFCTSASLRSRFPAIYPIGAQINNANELSVGTYGFLATDGATTFIGSNNHVIARNNAGVPGEVINQNLPGAANQVATLTRFVQIDFRSLAAGGANTVDGAIAAITGARQPTFITPCQGYGAMTERVLTPLVGDTVRKCGRTTDCTTGRILSVNSQTNVSFNAAGTQVAGFVDQINIIGVGGSNFSAAGDSGSGIVNATSNDPTGLLFAGAGAFTSANKMSNVVSALGVTIVGSPAGCPTTPVPGP